MVRRKRGSSWYGLPGLHIVAKNAEQLRFGKIIMGFLAAMLIKR